MIILIATTLWGCTKPQETQALISINITADQSDIQVNLASGSTVKQAIEAANLPLGELDEVDPALTATLSQGAQITVTRVREEYYTDEVVIPFDHQELRNDALPVGRRILSQPGENGLKQITYRRVYKNGIEVSNSVSKIDVIKEAVPEIEMIGSLSMFAAIPIPGKIAYLSAGNAWIIEGNTASQKLIVSTGDLDGRIFSLSRDGGYLLFTRFSSNEKVINSLWMAVLADDPIRIVDLKVKNIVHYAEINPNSSAITYSTSDWREASPGWQANNDLYEADFSFDGVVDSPRRVLASNSGGVYGWWGTEFAWAPDQSKLLFSRPDGLGTIDEANKTQTALLSITPYQSGGNWAWVPGATWSPDGSVIYTVNHVNSDMVNPNASKQFDLITVPLVGSMVSLVKNVGMFAYPITSPMMSINNVVDMSLGTIAEKADFLVAYLQALNPGQSDTSRYKLSVIERDGSNLRTLFPTEPDSGLSPQHVAWSPARINGEGNYGIVLVYNGNIWIINAQSGAAQQVTGDGLSTRVDWR